MQLVLGREPEQFVVRHGRPEEVGEATGQFVVAHAIGRAGVLVALDAEQKVRRHEHGLEREPDRVLKRLAARRSLLEQLQIGIHLDLLHRTAEGPRGEGFQVLSRGGVLRGEQFGPFDENFLRRCGFQHFACRLEIFLHEQWRHEECVRVVVEPAAAAAVRWKFVRRMVGEAEQVAHRQVVFQPAEAADDHATGVFGKQIVVDVVERMAAPVDQALAIRLIGLRLLTRRRHVALAHEPHDFFQFPRIALEVRLTFPRRQIQPTLGRVRVMAFETVLFEERVESVEGEQAVRGQTVRGGGCTERGDEDRQGEKKNSGLEPTHSHVNRRGEGWGIQPDGSGKDDSRKSLMVSPQRMEALFPFASFADLA